MNSEIETLVRLKYVIPTIDVNGGANWQESYPVEVIRKTTYRFTKYYATVALIYDYHWIHYIKILVEELCIYEEIQQWKRLSTNNQE